ncbi:peptidase S8/S53 domain-containing protein [Fusarium oxysporum]|nr:peptidase S8/S53 domain-containing protein [Fusarium oxysporum]
MVDLSRFGIFSLAAEADRSSTSRSVSTTDKQIFLVSIKRAVNNEAATNLIKSTLHSDGPFAWEEISAELKSSIIEATPGQIENLANHPDIVRVTPIEATTTEGDMQHDDDVTKRRYIVHPINRRDIDQCRATQNALKDLFGDHISTKLLRDGRICHWRALLSSEEVAQAKAIQGVLSVHTVSLGRRGPGRSRAGAPRKSFPEQNADMSYETQKNAAIELVAISQPSTIPDIIDLKNYVYESRAGRSSYVYHIETGVAFKAQSQEFPNVASKHLLTKNATKNNKEPWVDDDDEHPSHGTCGAGKALGARFGVSKQATLIVVRLDEVDGKEFLEGLDLILKDLDDHPERRKKSVVTMAFTVDSDWGAGELAELRSKFQELFSKDVPFVCLSGNIEEDRDDPDVDEYPPLLESPDLPLIVVGSVNSKGERSDFSKAGPHVTLHAVGESISCFSREGEVIDDDGTSFAAPQVAGEIANLLSYENVPFDTSDGVLVKNLKDYLQSNGGSWERVPGIRVLWNGVEEESNPKESVECNGLQEDYYVERDDVKRLIEDEFCPEIGTPRELRNQDSAISHTYNIGTPNKVTLSLYQDEPITAGECVKYLMMAVDDCYHIDNDPSDYKGGGQTVVGGSNYQVLPDHGEELNKQIKGCALLPDTWKFTYGIGDDGREWTARFRTGVFQKRCVGNAVGKASGFGDFGCAGSG